MDLWPCKGQNSGVHFAQSERVPRSAIYGHKTGQLHNSSIAVDITKRGFDPISQSSAFTTSQDGHSTRARQDKRIRTYYNCFLDFLPTLDAAVSITRHSLYGDISSSLV